MSIGSLEDSRERQFRRAGKKDDYVEAKHSVNLDMNCPWGQEGTCTVELFVDII